MQIEPFDEQNELIIYVQDALDRIQFAKNKSEKDRHLINLTSYLISSSNKIAEEHNYYEAAGRLYTAAYYLEEYYPQSAKDVYEKVIEYNIEYLKEKLRAGAINEAANISLKIAKIFEDKIQDFAKEKEYLLRAIGLIANQIEILQGFGSPRELAGKFQTLSMLYKKINQWDNLITSAESALEYAKTINDYSIVSNSYKNISFALENKGEGNKAENKVFEAMDYFSKEAANYEQKEEYLPLSQLYQIIKKFYAELRNPHKYKIYSRKEAATYISMAKLSLLYDTGDIQTAGYYRAAGLCYQETGQNYLDGASCFLMAAKHYEKVNKLLEAGLNYEDAAKNFERIGYMKKAFENYVKAGTSAHNANNLQSAIENYMWAHDLAQNEGYDKKKITELLYDDLSQLAVVEYTAENYFVSATLLLEALYYKVKSNHIKRQYIKEKMKEVLEHYSHVISENYIQKPSVKAYTYALVTIIALFLKEEKMVKETLSILQEIKSKIAKRYLLLIENVRPMIEKEEIIPIERLPVKIIKLLESSEEINITLKINNKFNSLKEND